MTGQDTHTDDGALLDFPGAGRLRAAGRVAPPSADVVAAALAAVRSAANPATDADRATGPDQAKVHHHAKRTGRAGGGDPVIGLEREPVAEIVPARTWRRHMPVLVSAAAVAAIALGATFQPWSDSGDERVTPATERARTAPYWKVRILQWNRTLDREQRPDESYETIWVSRNGTRGKPGNGLVQDYTRQDMGGTVWVICGEPVGWDELRKLPTDPEALRSRLVGEATGDSVPEELFDGIEDLLARSPAEPELRAALFDVLTGIPGARVTERVKDSTGRAGTVVELDADTWRRQLIVDTKSFHVLEAVDRARNDGLAWGSQKLRSGDVIHRTTYLSVGPAWQQPPLSPLR
ncbi:hypothetical protein OYE22_16200 [Streptomyces sp. 71268]|uniref:hypothetical protein n=1 Tax=Streptomyces sp. 71268 TaxID=3002640 RepID=UPI0023F79695|nr:hypothetical protein [Streptomyces sp. 71268]WEV26566.1 hypothetical protein OYE22_16200 [Streptomyces sp. 71268]